MTTDSFTEKSKLLMTGTAVSVIVSLTSVLLTAYVGNFATKEQVATEKAQREKDVALIKKDVEYIKKAVDDIRDILKK